MPKQTLLQLNKLPKPTPPAQALYLMKQLHLNRSTPTIYSAKKNSTICHVGSKPKFDYKAPAPSRSVIKAHLTPTRSHRTKTQGCQPTHLSIMMSLPLLEHEDPKVFSTMLIWHRVQDWMSTLSTPGHTPKILRLLASLRESPIRRLRISTTFASLVMMTPPFPLSKRQRRRGEGDFAELTKR